MGEQSTRDSQPLNLVFWLPVTKADHVQLIASLLTVMNDVGMHFAVLAPL